MINLRKINSLIVIIIFLMILNHGILSVLYMYGIIGYSPSFQITGRRLFYPVVAHIVISLYLYFKDRALKIKRYGDLISDTRKQIITGVMILVFVTLHIITYMMYPINSQDNFSISMLHFLIDNLLFVSIALHLKISIPRLFVSLGLLESKNSYENTKNRVSKIITIILIIFVLAEIIHYVVGL